MAKRDAKKTHARLVAMVRRDELRKLRAQIATAKARRREAVARVRQQCRAARVRLRDRIKAFRKAERERVNAEIALMRRKVRHRCKCRLDKVRRLTGIQAERARARIRERHSLEAQHKAKAMRLRKTTHRRESDDEVRHNLPPDLLGVWQTMKGRIRETPRMSRTEAFLHWAEENPGEVLAAQADAAELEVRRLVREYERTHRAAAGSRRRRPTLAEVPF